MFGLKYDQAIDRESAYEVLAKKAADAAANGAAGATQPGAAAGKDEGLMGVVNDFLFGSTGPRGGKKDGLVQSMIKTETKRAATKVLRGVLGSLFGGKR